MTSDSTVVPLRRPEEIDDPLTAVLREGARRLLAQAVEAEAEAFLAAMKGLRLPDGRERVVRHGHGPERPVQTGIGPVPVRRVLTYLFRLPSGKYAPAGRCAPLPLGLFWCGSGNNLPVAEAPCQKAGQVDFNSQ